MVLFSGFSSPQRQGRSGGAKTRRAPGAFGDLLLPERHARLVALTLSVGAAAARMRPGHRSISGETNENGPSKG